MSVMWNLNDSTTFLLPNIYFLFPAKWLHSTKKVLLFVVVVVYLREVILARPPIWGQIKVRFKEPSEDGVFKSLAVRPKLG